MKKHHKIIAVIGLGLVALFDGLFITTDLIKGLANWRWILSLEIMGIVLLAGKYFLKNQLMLIKLNMILHLSILLIGYGLHISGYMRILETFPMLLLVSVTIAVIMYLIIARPVKNRKYYSVESSFMIGVLKKQAEEDARQRSLALSGAPNKYHGAFRK